MMVTVKHPDRGPWARLSRALVLSSSAAALLLACADVGDPWYVERAIVVAPPGGPVDFVQDVLPILVNHGCTVCHGGADPEQGLDVTTAESFVAGGDDGPAIVRCDHTASAVMTWIGRDPCLMPPEGDCLSEVELEIFRTWIDEGALGVPDDGFCGGGETPGE